jgi:hypothetical protein
LGVARHFGGAGAPCAGGAGLRSRRSSRRSSRWRREVEVRLEDSAVDWVSVGMTATRWPHGPSRLRALEDCARRRADLGLSCASPPISPARRRATPSPLLPLTVALIAGASPRRQSSHARSPHGAEGMGGRPLSPPASVASRRTRARGRWTATSGRLVAPRGAPSIPLDLEEAGAQRFFPELLQETAATFSPSKTDGKEDSTVLKETGAGGLRWWL